MFGENFNVHTKRERLAMYIRSNASRGKQLRIIMPQGQQNSNEKSLENQNLLILSLILHTKSKILKHNFRSHLPLAMCTAQRFILLLVRNYVLRLE